MSEVDELDLMMARAIRQELEANSSTAEEIARVLCRLPFDHSEVSSVTELLRKWRGSGRLVRLGPAQMDNEEATRDEKADRLMHLLNQGLMFLYSADFGAEFLIVKVDGGRGFLGGQKTQFACYYGDGSRQFQPVAVVKHLAMALTKVGMIYRM